MNGSIYSQMKPAWHPDRLVAMREGAAVRPVHVQLILSDLCNQDCSFCAYRMSSGLSTELFAVGELAATGHNNPKRQIAGDKAAEIIEDCAKLGVKAIQFTGGGEPTTHPDHLRLFELAQQLGMDTALVTNGVRLDPHAPGVLGMEWIRVSVDAGDPETYARVRRVPAGHWSKVWANVTQLALRYRGTLGIGFVVTPDNFRGIITAAHAAKDAGASNLRVGAVFSSEGREYYGDFSSEFESEVEDLIARAKQDCDGDGFEVVDLFGRRMGDLAGGAPTHPSCGYQLLTWYIGGDLNLYRCCNTAYTKAGVVGSLIGRRLVELVGAHEPFDARGCSFCQFRGQNDAIRSLVEQPGHVNFV